MSKALISNPPYNMKWSLPPFAQIQPRFSNCELPPEKNANFAFILSALDMVDNRAVFILPCGVLAGGLKEEVKIRQYLIDKNLIEAVITCPDNMFESTSIATCIIVFNKRKTTTNIELIDMRQVYDTDEREQRGQYGGSAHTNRTYKKSVKVFSQEHMKRAINAISEHTCEKDFSICVSLEKVKNMDYKLLPSAYFEVDINDIQKHREYTDIIDDLNRVIEEENGIKLTVNESLAKSLGLYDTFLMFKQSREINDNMNKMLQFTGRKIVEEKFIALSKNAGELKFENLSKNKVSTILLSILQMWKQHIMYLNNEENRYLIELRDALIPDLMSGKINLDETEEKSEDEQSNIDGEINQGS